MRSLLATLVLVLLCGVGGDAFGDMYKYVDENGAVCITNSLDAVPKRFRKTMTVVREEAPAQKKLLPEVQKRTTDPLPQARESRPVLQEPPPTPADNRQKYLQTALLIAGIVGGYFLLSRLGGSLGYPRVGTLLFLLLLLLGGVYLYGLYVKEMQAVFGKLRTDAVNIRKNVETRENKTDQMLKQLSDKDGEQAEGGSRSIPADLQKGR